MFVLLYCEEIETPKEDKKVMRSNKDKSDINERMYCIVDSNNVLWTCHKACNIEFSDCDYSICSKCYSAKTLEKGDGDTRNGRKTSKRRRLVQSIDDDNTMCRHDVASLVPFMDKSFFTSKYKDTIRENQYMLPMNCSECDAVLVDKKPTDKVNSKKHCITEI